MIDSRTFFGFIIVAALVAVLSFWVVGPFSMRVDGAIYLSQIEQFEAGELVLTPHTVALRAFKPLPGVWGSVLVPFLDPAEALQVLNLLFLFGLPFVAYSFLKELGFKSDEAWWGSLWIVTGYPLLKYGLALGTDLGGWFFTLLTASLVLKGIRMRSLRTLVLASLFGFLGGTIKESGVFGLLFGGLYILFTSDARPLKDTRRYIFAVGVPALVLESVLVIILLKAGFPSFLDWYGVVRGTEFIESNYKITKFVGVFCSTFNILLPLMVVGSVALLRRCVRVGQHPYAQTCALLVASLPVLLWTVFISRVLYIQFLFVVPMALQGVHFLQSTVSGKYQKVVGRMLYILPIVCSVGLFLLAGSRSLFEIIF